MASDNASHHARALSVELDGNDDFPRFTSDRTALAQMTVVSKRLYFVVNVRLFA
jgi:hypothetical protein